MARPHSFLHLLFSVSIGLTYHNADASQELRELSEAEADAIVREEYRAAETGKQSEGVSRDRVVTRKDVIRNGKRTVFEKIAPSAIQATPSNGTRTSRNESVQDETDERESKRMTILSISATVYDRAVTELHWSTDGVRRTGFSNMDFALLRGTRRIETDTTIYHLNLGLGEQARPAPDDEKPSIPTAGDFSRVGTYFVASDGTAKEVEMLAGLDAIHLFYRENKRRLEIDDQRRRALSAARQRHRKANPAKRRPTVIQFWRKDQPAGTDPKK